MLCIRPIYRFRYPLKHTQQGAAFIVMLVIMIIGVTTLLVGAFSNAGLQTARNEKSSDLLAQAKEVVIGYMLKGGTSTLGWMMMPDVLNVPSATEKSPIDNSLTSNYDGEWESNCFDSTKPTATPPYTPLTGNNTNKRCFGRLPWKSLGMSFNSPSENDPTGFMPWYAFSRNLITATTPVNSELLNTSTYPWLKVYDMNGALLNDRVAFVIIIPGAALPYQSRPPSPNLAGPDQYLDSISLPVGCSPSGTPCTTTYRNYNLSETFVTGDEHRWMNDLSNPGKQIEDPTYQFNDKLLYVTIDELMPLIEKRIAREVKACLDDYANMPTAAPSHRYPWAAPVTDMSYATTPNTFFGRIPATPTYSVTNPALTTLLNNLQTALNNLQSAETACQTSDSSANTTALTNAANALLTAAGNMTVPPFSSSSQLASLTSYANAAALAAKPTSAGGSTYSDPCDYIDNDHPTSQVQSKLTSANDALPNVSDTSPEDSTMEPSWATTPSCNQLLATSSYWPDWRDLVFYQVAEGYQPSGGTFAPLHISGSGNPLADNNTYRAAVIVAGKMLPGQSPRNPTATPPITFLEGANQHPPTPVSTPADVSFVTYKPSDATDYSTVNDLVLCVDGRTNCK